MPKVLVRECLPKKDVPHIFTTEISPISSKWSFHESVSPPTLPNSPLMVIFLILIEECNALLAHCPFYMHVTMGTKLHRKKITGIRRRIRYRVFVGAGFSVYSVIGSRGKPSLLVWDHYNEYGTTVCTVAYAVLTPSLPHTEPVFYRLRRNVRALLE